VVAWKQQCIWVADGHIGFILRFRKVNGCLGNINMSMWFTCKTKTNSTKGYPIILIWILFKYSTIRFGEVWFDWTSSNSRKMWLWKKKKDSEYVLNIWFYTEFMFSYIIMRLKYLFIRVFKLFFSVAERNAN
jgi:hypothetical protein